MKRTISIILETHNLEGGDADLQGTLQRLLDHLDDQSRRPDELIITHRRDDKRHHGLRVPGATTVDLPHTATYYDAKNAGFARSTKDIVVFADSDCWPDPRWLHHLVTPIERGHAEVVAGRTTYRDGLLGAAASTIDFLYFDPPGSPDATLNFYANNVAFERDVFAAHPFPAGPAMYRGHCQMLGAELHRHQIPIHFARGARTIHRFPDHLRELMTLRLLRGRDLTLLAPHLAEAYLPQAAGLSSATLSQLVFAGRLKASLHALRHDYGYSAGIRRAAAASCVIGLSALDWLGALGGGQRAFDRGRHRGGPVLSYHRDRLRDAVQAVRAM